MITLKDWMEAVDYRITEGSDYCWGCFGHNAYSLDSWDGDHEGVSASIVFSRETQEVFEATVYDYARDRAYRLINPLYKQSHLDESNSRGADPEQAWDDVKFVDLELDGDFMSKLESIMHYETYDTRVSVPLDLDRDTMFRLMLEAHSRDLTVNELVEDILWQAIKDENV